MIYPIAVAVTPAAGERDRLTTAFRLILALPHMILVAGPGAFASGLLGSAVAFLSFVNWCAIVFTGQTIGGIHDFTSFFLRWHLRASAYAMLLVDPYPPFGDAAYPATVTVPPAPAVRDKPSVGLRLILVIPHLIVLGIVAIVWAVTTIVAWFAILLTGRYPDSLFEFGVGCLRWFTRVNAYSLLLVDEYPPFSFD
jgi:hypothetical protein